jgi:hypothetical protein
MLKLPMHSLFRPSRTMEVCPAQPIPRRFAILRVPLAAFSIAAFSLPLPAQESPAAPIGHTSATEVQVSGAVDVHGGQMQLGNGSTITAADRPVKIDLSRGGDLLLCSTTSLHLSRDRSIPDPANTALMMALDRGALEAHYTVGKYSDVLLTPDLRILVSGPGNADLSVRVNPQGDTCVDNHGADAPYVTVASDLEGGVYRVLPDQRVMFEHGSLREMVDRETEPCGCPPEAPIAVASGAQTGAVSSAASDNPFPLKESEGLGPPPSPPLQPVVPPGQVHAEVTVPLVYNGENPAPPAAAPAAAGTVAAPATAAPANEVPPPQPPHGFFHRIGHFFSAIFH